MKNPIRIAVAMDHGLNREGVRKTVALEPDVQVVAFAEGLDEHRPTVLETPADMTVVACNGQADRAIGFIAEATSRDPDRPVLVLTGGSPEGFVRRAFDAGAEDIVTFANPETVTVEQMSEQVLFALEKAMARRRRAPGTGTKLATMVCTLGPKGGIGKTLTTTNLAAALASRGKRVAIVDVDLQFGDVGLALGLAPDRTLYDLATSSGSLDAEKLEAFMVTHGSGARALLAPTRPDHAAAVTVDVLREVYPLLRANNDFVVVDTPPGFTPEVIASIDAATDVCMVGTLDSLSLKNTRLGLETLELMGFDRERIRVVLNRADSRVGITHNDVLAIIGRPPDIFVPSHRDVARSMNEGVPIAVADKRADASRAFQRLATFYLDETPGKPSAPAAKPRRRWLGRRR